MEKRKPTSEEWQQIRVLYLEGMKPRFIVKKFPELDITAKAISSKFSNNKTKEKRDRIKQKVEEKLLEDIVKEQENANRELIQVSKKIVEVVKKYLENEQYLDFAGFNYGKMLKTRSNTLNTFAFRQVVKALSDAQKIQRLALGMDDETADKLPDPVININFGDKKE